MRQRLIAVVGTTGVGKSQLGVELAKALSRSTNNNNNTELAGEVINSDALQMYKGLDIATNKMPLAERGGVAHHLMDFESPKKAYSVVDFEEQGVKTISEIHRRNNIPILVGGTNYYVQSLIWKDSLIAGEPGTATHNKGNNQQVSSESTATTSADAKTHSTLSPSSAPEIDVAVATSSNKVDPDTIDLDAEMGALFEQLKAVDPIMAQKWHPNDVRKIRRSLEVYKTTGQRHSDLMIRQKSEDIANVRLRYPTCIFWLYAKHENLTPRLDARVDDMLKNGLLNEIRGLRKELGPEEEEHDEASDQYGGLDSSKGIRQAIGYKEFLPYLRRLDDEGHNDSITEKMYLEAVEKMKQRTRRYARKQVGWVRKKLWEDVSESNEMVKLFLLDANDLTKWNTNVRDVAVKIAQDFLDDKPTPDPESLSKTASDMLQSLKETSCRTPLTSWTKMTCEHCTQKTKDGQEVPFVANGPHEWKTHINTNQHRQGRKRRKWEEALKHGEAGNDEKKQRTQESPKTEDSQKTEES